MSKNNFELTLDTIAPECDVEYPKSGSIINTNVDVNVAFNKRKQLLNVRNCTNGGTTSTERLTSSYKVKNSEIDISSRLDPCLNIPMLDNPYANAFLS